MIERTITDTLIWECFAGKAIILYWPRQVGKTTLVKKLQEHFKERKSLYITGDDIEIKEIWKASIQVLSQLVAGAELIIIDEAQKIDDIGNILKLLVDNHPEKQIIATWSSSFDLAHNISEPLTGRAYIHHLYPLSIEEIYEQKPLSSISIEQRMLYWWYPNAVVGDNQNPQDYLKHVIDHYLYKDILAFEWIKKHDLVIKLTQALALQIGNEFSYLELANLLWSNKDTIAKYMLILEQAFIIKTLSPLHTNKRREIKAHKKVFFRDLWVRNAAINNFNPLNLRNDVWQLWENLCFIERTKYIQYRGIPHRQYFWRQTSWPEIDYIEQEAESYYAREFKYSIKKWASLPKAFAERYTDTQFDVIRTDTIGKFVR